MSKHDQDETLAWLFAQTRAGAPKGPVRTRALLDALGHPENQFEAIHVVGTNGKGSVCAMLDAGLQAQGLRVGRFTSPHLSDVRERITVNGECIPMLELKWFVNWVRAQNTEVAFFDVMTAMAFWWFARVGVDVAVVEAGVGAAKDHTSTLARVRVGVLTNVGLDHTETIGPGLQDIALEKSGVLRQGVPCVTATKGAALVVVQAEAETRGAVLHVYDAHNPLFFVPRPPAMLGAHQQENAALALAALRLCGAGEAACDAALNATWPGRMEWLRLGDKRVLLDGAHNPDGALALARCLTDLGRQDLGLHGLGLVFAAKHNKENRAMLQTLLPFARACFYTSFGALAEDPRVFASVAPGGVFDNPETALLAALAHHDTVLVAGSLYLVGALRTRLLEMGAV